MKTELMYLVWVTVLTALIWIPYILDRIMVWGLLDTVGYPENPKSQSPWARRMMKAHDNAIENLVVFAALVLVAQDLGVSNEPRSSRVRRTSGRGWSIFWPIHSRCPGSALSPSRQDSLRR